MMFAYRSPDWLPHPINTSELLRPEELLFLVKHPSGSLAPRRRSAVQLYPSSLNERPHCSETGRRDGNADGEVQQTRGRDRQARREWDVESAPAGRQPWRGREESEGVTSEQL